MNAPLQFGDASTRLVRPAGVKFGIALKLTLIFALFAAILLGVAGWLAYQQGETALRESTVAELQEQAIGKQAAIAHRLREMVTELAAFAEAPHIVEHMTGFANLPAGMTDDDRPALAKDLEARTGDARGEDFSSLFVVDLSGQVLAATDPADAVPVKANEPFFVSGKLASGFIFGSVQADSRESITVSAPLRTTDGTLAGVLVGRLGATTLAEIVDQRAGFRRTDEAYLIDTAGSYVSRPRLLPSAEAAGPDRSEAARRCLAHGDGLVEADDYRGIAALTVYRWMTEFGLCLITKIDQSEAYAAIDQLGRGLTLAGAVLLVLASGFSLLLARTITRPIRVIEAGAARIEHGERNLVLPETSSDELGRLARAFNKMTAALGAQEAELRRNASDLERRVADKTRELDQRAEELARSNVELERFAYVASHDLQEPLRMVASYTQLLAKRYKGKLDTDADEFIAFAVDGATRMQALINDLLTYSRVSTKASSFGIVDCELLVDTALKNLQGAQLEAGAIIRRTSLPKIAGDGFQLIQLFQNLIGNAIKFRRGPGPTIEISARRDGDEWVFMIADDGIGIDAKYIDQLFAVFKRLHTRAEYPGTGIGLAICKKVVERHHGRIWVESVPGEGSAFCFTIPAGVDTLTADANSEPAAPEAAPSPVSPSPAAEVNQP